VRVTRDLKVFSGANEATGNKGVGVQNRMEGEDGSDWATSTFADVIYLEWSVLRMDRWHLMRQPSWIQKQLEVAYMVILCAPCIAYEHLHGDVGGGGPPRKLAQPP